MASYTHNRLTSPYSLSQPYDGKSSGLPKLTSFPSTRIITFFRLSPSAEYIKVFVLQMHHPLGKSCLASVCAHCIVIIVYLFIKLFPFPFGFNGKVLTLVLIVSIPDNG